MKMNQKIELTAEEREAIEKKETRNQVIETAIAIGTTVAGLLISRHLQKKLNAELEAMIEDEQEDEETN